MKRAFVGIAILGIVGGVTGGIPVSAALEPIGWQDPNSVFEVRKDYGFTCGTVPTFSFRDNENNSFDNGGLASVAGTYIGIGVTNFDLTPVDSDDLATYPTTGTEAVGDLRVSVSYRITSGNIVRTMVTITNIGATDAIDVPVNIENSVPSDSSVHHVLGDTWRSSGDWFVMGDNNSTNPSAYSYPPSFHAPDGPGSPESPATVAVCNGTLRNLYSVEPPANVLSEEELVFGYLVDIPASATRRILVMQGAGVGTSTVETVKQSTEDFDPAGQTPGNGILSDLSDADACTVVNWAFEVCDGGGGSDFDIDIDHYQRRAAEESDRPDTV